jgi:hypothetical protein
MKQIKQRCDNHVTISFHTIQLKQVYLISFENKFSFY